MDDERFAILYDLVHELSPGRTKRHQHSDASILLLWLWAALRNKPVCWACDARNRPRRWRGPLPSPSCVSRRLRGERIQTLFDLALLTLQQRLLVASTLVGCWKIDAKGLPVNRFSKDKQARWGYCCGGKARGYKLFLLIDASGTPVAWRVDAMNVAEPAVARELIEHIHGPGYLLGDSIYDWNDLYRLLSDKQVQLIAPRKVPLQPIGSRARHPARLRAIAMLETPLRNTMGATLYNDRTQIERVFSRWASSAVCLDHLPGWIRTLPRVQRWINAKILIAIAA